MHPYRDSAEQRPASPDVRHKRFAASTLLSWLLLIGALAIGGAAAARAAPMAYEWLVIAIVLAVAKRP